MVELIIINPLPRMLNLSNNGTTLAVHIAYKNNTTLNTLLEDLAVDYPGFEKILHDKSNTILSELSYVINGNVLYYKDAVKELIPDNSKIQFLVPYSGG